MKFNGINNGTLLEAKSSYDNFVNKNGEFQDWFIGKDPLVDQARRQLEAANGSVIEWNFSSQKSLNATKTLFEQNNIRSILLKYTPIN
ncbi:Tox-REase-5 domain-containing protein [Pedobacter vanadiisoli]|uniref:Tox-REase-5 domain-containing protein n=1 Tax=Pedobacter vanadiisoli TaxID=1761975 RepID=A0ABW5MNG1_9SPHI